MDTEKETAQIREVKRILNNSKSGSAKEPDVKISNLCPSKEFVDGLICRRIIREMWRYLRNRISCSLSPAHI